MRDCEPGLVHGLSLEQDDVEMSDVEEINGEDTEENSNGEDITSKDEGSDSKDETPISDQEETDHEGDQGEELDKALASALGTHRADKDVDAESSNSDADMDDDEMMQLDDKLVEIFKQRKKAVNKKQEKKDGS